MGKMVELMGCKLPQEKALFFSFSFAFSNSRPPSSVSSSSFWTIRIRCCSENQNQGGDAIILPEAISNGYGSRGANETTAQGEKGLFALAPPHQGIDGEWSDRSGVIVYKWNEKNDRPKLNTGSANWKKRWSCCSEYDEKAPPCQRGWHVSYDDGFTLY